MNSLRSLLLVLNDECTNNHSVQRLRQSQKDELAARLQACKTDLSEVKKILYEYRSLSTSHPRFRDRLAFTTGRQADLQQKINAHSARLQQFTLGMGVGSFSRIETKIEAVLSLLPLLHPSHETHLLSSLEIREKLEEIHRDILNGRRGVFATNDTDAAVSLEDEVLGDNMTEVDVDVSNEVYAWIARVRAETTGLQQDPMNEPEDVHRELSRPPLEDVHRELSRPPLETGALLEEKKQQKPIIDLRNLQLVEGTKTHATYCWEPSTESWKEKVEDESLRSRLWKGKVKYGAARVVELQLTLEEVYTGTVKRLLLRRESLPSTSNLSSLADLRCVVDVPKGVRSGYKARYIGLGYQHKTYTEDVIFRLNRVSVPTRATLDSMITKAALQTPLV